jgi:hypothetical protein
VSFGTTVASIFSKTKQEQFAKSNPLRVICDCFHLKTKKRALMMQSSKVALLPRLFYRETNCRALLEFRNRLHARLAETTGVGAGRWIIIVMQALPLPIRLIRPAEMACPTSNCDLPGANHRAAFPYRVA